MSQQVIDIVARLLATENLSVVRDNVETASFDLVDRILTMPIFKGMTPIIEEMMVGHEVGHAKYTTWKLLEEANKYHKYLPAYFNVTEDVRIEKHMKRNYPGLRKSFTGGYKALNEMDFFGVKRKDLNDLNLIDRINLYHKVGGDCGVEFTDEEFEFVTKSLETESERNALDLAIEIFEYQRKKGLPPLPKQPQQSTGPGKKVKGQSGAGNGTGGKGDGETDSDDREGTGSDEDEEGSGKPASGGKDSKAKGSDGEEGVPGGRKGSQFGHGGVSDPDAPSNYLEAKTVEHFEGKLKSVADTKTKYQYHTIVPIYGVNPLVSYKRVLKETATIDQYVTKTAIQAIKDDSKKAIGYLIKEFEMRKSAEANKRVLTAKTGSLDNRKLYAYSLKDDIFRRNTIVPRGKNHGMVFLIDWSISMNQTIDQVLRQTVDLATFCRRCQIPFDVLAFTTGYLRASPDHISGTSGAKAIQGDKQRKAKSPTAMTNGDGNFHLLQLLSSEMTNSEFEKMTNRLLSKKLTAHAAYTLGGTPLNEALLYMVKHLPEFRAKHRLEKLSFITMTDGEGHTVHNFPDTAFGSNGMVVNKHFIRDTVNKRDYPVSGTSGQTHAILKYIRDHADVTSIGFHIMTGMGEHADAIKTMHGAPESLTGKKLTDLVNECRSEILKNGAYNLNSTSRDAMFIIQRDSLTQKSVDVKVKDGDSADEIAAALTKSLKTRKGNRLVLDKFIQTIA